MKKSIYIIFTLFLFTTATFAQNEGANIIAELNTYRAGQGRVKIMQDEVIDGLLAIHQQTDTTRRLGVLEHAAEYEKVRGFRIQVYSGNNQAVSKNEAFSRKAQVESAFPELDAEVISRLPFWRLRVGHFLKREDAEIVLQEMKKALPRMAKEMYVVPDEVKRPVK
ncbi:MAG: SPOR domain-containing protein [Prevotella sp.]|jgi:hypothetical protein|nr:SPOR domain-containing protein [Prevotella sp.]